MQNNQQSKQLNVSFLPHPARAKIGSRRRVAGPAPREDGWTGVGPRQECPFLAATNYACARKDSQIVSPKSSQVSAVGTGPERVMRAKEPKELRGVTKREFGEHEP